MFARYCALLLCIKKYIRISPSTVSSNWVMHTFTLLQNKKTSNVVTYFINLKSWSYQHNNKKIYSVLRLKGIIMNCPFRQEYMVLPQLRENIIMYYFRKGSGPYIHVWPKLGHFNGTQIKQRLEQFGVSGNNGGNFCIQTLYIQDLTKYDEIYFSKCCHGNLIFAKTIK